MSDFQKKTLLKGVGKVAAFSAAFGILYFTFTCETIAKIFWLSLCGLVALPIIGIHAWELRFDWKLRGKLTEKEYEAYCRCERYCGFDTWLYLPTWEDTRTMAELEDDDMVEALASMYEKVGRED